MGNSSVFAAIHMPVYTAQITKTKYTHSHSWTDIIRITAVHSRNNATCSPLHYELGIVAVYSPHKPHQGQKRW